MSAHFLELSRTVLFFFSSPHMFSLRMISSLLVLAPHGEEAKTVVRLATHKLFVSVDAVVGLELLATTLADKHIPTVLPNCVLVSRSQRLESLVTDLTGVNPLPLSCFLYPHTDPIQQQHEFPHKPALNIFISRC